MNTLKVGLKNGLQTTWALGKVIFPITLIMTILSYTAVFDQLIHWISPAMHWLGLPGEAAVPLVFANCLNLYAGIGAVLSLDLTVKSVLILAVMMSFSHNLFIESGVAAKVGVRLWVMFAVRIGLAIVSAILIANFWDGGGDMAEYGMLSSSETTDPVGWMIVWSGIEKAIAGIIQLAVIVIPLMIFIQFLKDRQWLKVFSSWMAPITRALGMSSKTSTTLAAGLLFGLAYGSGVMIQAVKDDGVDRRSLYLAFIFLVSCHAVIEDTLVFVPLGIPVWPLLLIRFVVAVILTGAIAFVWNRKRPATKQAKASSY
ncbi:nucleoside recognition domain-containing protein [Tuberibacillus sp. Marseille-P3662]|uniref:nucleoside recognition domain-containing protein n=1 Tax=Tuberibacillus sp. Marseille-P3662 TaxID=1965358 RepID=UPI00111C36C5|nr:nucleoside recognition domain-containing protein [Tuberibacillus sp. Marseille-P3662]